MNDTKTNQRKPSNNPTLAAWIILTGAAAGVLTAVFGIVAPAFEFLARLGLHFSTFEQRATTAMVGVGLAAGLITLLVPRRARDVHFGRPQEVVETLGNRIHRALVRLHNDVFPRCGYCGCHTVRPTYATYLRHQHDLPDDVDPHVKYRVPMHASCAWYAVRQPGRNRVEVTPDATTERIQRLIPR